MTAPAIHCFRSISDQVFYGYKRSNGWVGTCNFIGILTTVNCSATVARKIASQIEYGGASDELLNSGAVVFVTHGIGSGMQSCGRGFETL